MIDFLIYIYYYYYYYYYLTLAASPSRQRTAAYFYYLKLPQIRRGTGWYKWLRVGGQAIVGLSTLE